MQIGRKIYYGKSNGVVIWDKGEMEGDVVPTTLEQDKDTMPTLTLLEDSELGICQLNYGEYANEFQTCKGYIIDNTTEKPKFIF